MLLSVFAIYDGNTRPTKDCHNIPACYSFTRTALQKDLRYLIFRMALCTTSYELHQYLRLKDFSLRLMRLKAFTSFTL